VHSCLVRTSIKLIGVGSISIGLLFIDILYVCTQLTQAKSLVPEKRIFDFAT